MRYFVARNGQTTGPVDEEQVIGWVRAGMVDAQVQAESGGPWMWIVQSPFAGFAPPGAYVNRSELAPRTQFLLVVVGTVLAFGVILVFTREEKKPVTTTVVAPAAPPPPAPAPPPAKPGIGITRTKLRADYEREGFVFEQSSDVRGEPRITGKSSDGLAYVELIGDPRELTVATLMVGVTKETIVDASARSLGFLNRVAPEWEGSSDWFSKSLKKSPKESETTYGGKLFSVQPLPTTSMVVISVRRDVDGGTAR